MKKMLTRPVTTFVEKLCDVKYYVKADPYTDPHFRPDPSFVMNNAYFDTIEEAEALKKEKEKVFFGELTVYELITELE